MEEEIPQEKDGEKKPEEENREYHYIYFNEIHDKSKEIKMEISNEYEGNNTLEIFDGKNPFESNYNSTTILKIYRFKLYPDLFEQNKKIKINIEQNNNKSQFIFNLEKIDIHKDYYEYDLDKGIDQIDFIKTSYEQQLEIYNNFIQNTLKKKQDSRENEEFILSTQKSITENNIEYTFYFYILIFKKCLDTKMMQKHLLIFDPTKISEIGNVPEKEIKAIKTLIDNRIKKANEIIIDNEEQRQKIIQQFYFVIFYFNNFFNKEKTIEMMNDNEIFELISDKLFIYNKKFTGLTLTNEQCDKLIVKAENFNQILIIMNYLGYNLLNLIKVIYNNFEKISKLSSEKPKDKEKVNDEEEDYYIIKADYYAVPNANDNLEEIYTYLNQLLTFEKLKNNQIILKFIPEFFHPYKNYNVNINLNNLIFLKEIIENIKKLDKKFELDLDLNEYIHITGLKLIEEKKLNNNDILLFIDKNNYYNDKDYAKNPERRNLKILDGIDIQTLDINHWQNYDFKEMFKYQLDEFAKKVVSFVKHMKDFGKLFQLLKVDKSDNIPTAYINELKRRYKELFETYSVKGCPNFLDDSAKLLLLIHKSKVSFREFLRELQKSLDINMINKILIKLSEGEIPNDLNKKIVDFFTKEKNANPTTLIFLINNCKKLRKDIFQNMDIFIPTEEDIFDINDNENFKLLRGLIDQKIIEKNNKKLGEKYLMKTTELLSNISNKLENFEITYHTLIPFDTKENESKLIDIIYYIYLKDKAKSRSVFSRIINKKREIKTVLDKYEKVIKYFSMFFPRSNNALIQNMSSIVSDISNNSLNTYQTKYKSGFNKYEKYYEEAIKMELYIQSKFFLQIFKETKKQYENYIKEDIYYLNEAKKKFEQLKILFEKDGIMKINPQILEICIKTIKENPDSLQEELRILQDILGIDILNDDIDFLDRICDELVLLSQKDKIFNISVAINSFLIAIEQKKKTNFSNDIKKIIKNLKEKNKIELIKESKEILKKYGINIDQENLSYISILLELNKNQESIIFLFNTDLKDCGELKQLSLQSDNNIVSTNDILDMEKCIEFLLDFKQSKDKTDIDIINLFKEKVSKREDIFAYFQKYVTNFAQIKTLNSPFSKSETLKNQINAIFEQAIFEVNNSNDKQNSFLCNYNILENDNWIMKKLKEEDIKNLRDRAQISKNNITEEYKYLIDVINEIIEIHNIIRELCYKGYPKKIRVQVKLSKEKKDDKFNFSCSYHMDGLEKHNPNEIKDILNSILNQLIKDHKEAYDKRPLICLYFGRKFCLLNDHVHKLIYNNTGINSFLKYLTNDLNKTPLKNFIPEKSPDVIKNNINDCENYLSELLKINNITYKDIISQTIIKQEKVKYQGFYTYLCNKLETSIFQIHTYLTGNPPIAQNILLCTKETFKDEILTFMHRVVKCEYNSCFIIAGVENLDYEQTIYMVDLLDEFFGNEKEKNKINSCVIFLYTNNNAEICVNIESKKYREILPIKGDMYKNIKYDKDDIEIIMSDKSGVGKSTQINKDIEDKGKKCIHFPIGDVVERDSIIKRLKDLQVDSKSVVHLDLYDTDNVSLMIEFLFSFLILRYYGKDEDVFYLSKDIEIKIEIPNTFINFIEKFPILKIFKIREIKITELSPLIVPKEIYSNIQVVSNYLKFLKEGNISDYDLIIPKITSVDLIEMIKKGITYKKPKRTIITAVGVAPLSQEICQNLIFDYIKTTIKNPTYYQINTFINILAVQFKKFNQNYFLSAHNLKLSAKDIYTIRKYIINNFIDLTKYFTEGAFTNLLKNKEIKHEVKFGNYDKAQENKENENAVNDLANDKHHIMSFKDIDSTLVFFHEGVNESFSIITNKQPNDQEYINFLQLKNCQVYRKEEKLKSLTNFNDKNLEKKVFLEELKNILAVNNPITKEEKRKIKSEYNSFEEITTNYVITPDNFIKMVLILLRIRSNIPVIMMGETGCGKTSLIRKLSELKNNGNPKKMRIKNIHAGTNDTDIINFITKDVIPFAEEISYKNKKERESHAKKNMLYEEVKLWVFLDEINTCKSMGLISELMCKHSCQGTKLPENIVFIAACNPYRKKEKKGKKEEEIGLNANLAFKEKKHLNEKEKEELERKRDLVYLVNPLPHSLLNFVFDFGGLEQQDEESYIRCIIEEALVKLYYGDKKDLVKDDKKMNDSFILLKKLAQEMVTTAHNFIKKYNDKSIVSLREIRRFNIFYEFFYDYLKKRKENIEEEKDKQIFNKDEEVFYQNLNHFEMQVYSINLSIFLCYYLRINGKTKRKEFVREMNKIFQKDEINQKLDFLEVPLKEEQFLVNNIKLDKGIAKNRALLENIFSLFAALNSKVPIFIVGKPGCSKSLSFQLINKSMQAGGSESTFFRKYSKLLVNPFQGSMASTSQGVENVFNKARENYKLLNPQDKKTNISMIFFDEMGLAEHSPNNPLKVIHSELEYDENKGENKIAFLGISNWSLDAAKMNRGITISIPDLNEDDNIETSLTIGKSYNENLAVRYEKFYKDLGWAYYEYRNYLLNNYRSDGRQDFHGNRDFYHLIKIFTRNLIAKEKNNLLDDDTLIESAINSIERNFGGIVLDNDKSSVEKFKEILKKKYPALNIQKDYNVVQRAKESIKDMESRYLLIITKGPVSMYLISSILLENKKFCFYIGSKFKDDLNKEDYTTKIMNKIQIDIESGMFLIFKDLETVYPHMYDLFNQNFTVISNKNYARIAVGNSTNAYCLVNDNFKCIVNVDINKIPEEEPPFLNRFEKHIITFEDILSEELISLSKEIYENLSDLSFCNEEFKSIDYSLEKLLINCNLDEIQALIYKADLEGKKTREEIYDYIFSKIALTLPQDIIINMKYGKFGRNNPQYFEKIMNYYKEGVHTNLSEFFKHMTNTKNIVYTFSHKMEKINNIDEVKTKKIIIGMLKKENDLEKLFDEFFLNDNYLYCLIQFMPNETELINNIKYLIESKEKEYRNKTKKCFIFIIHMFRISKEVIKEMENNNDKKYEETKNKILNETLTNLAGYYQIFIDNLNGDENLKIENIINTDDKTKYNFCIDVNKELPSAIFTAQTYIKYMINDSYEGLNKDNYIQEVSNYILNNEKIRNSINNCFFRELKKFEESDVIIKILKNPKTKFSIEVKDLINLIKQELLKIYNSLIYILFFKLEKNQFFSSLLCNEYLKQSENIQKKETKKKKDINIIEKISEFYLSVLKFNDGKTKITIGLQKNKVDIILRYRYPGLKPVLEKIISKIKENISKEYRRNENNLRGLLDDEEEETNYYFRKLFIFDSSAVNIINDEEIIKGLVELYKDDKIFLEELFNLIKHDYYYNFLKKNINQINKEKSEELNAYNLEDNIKFMDLIYKIRDKSIKRYFKQNENDKDLDIISRLAKIFNFFESYVGEITKINEMFLKLSQQIPELYSQVEEKVKNKDIKFEISKRNPEYTTVVNETFFISVDSLLRVIITNENIYKIQDKDSDEILFNLISTYKEILQIALSLNNELTFRTKESVSLEEILKILDAFTNIKMLNIDNLIETINYFKNETRYINENNSFKLCQNFEIFSQNLLKKFEKNENKKFNMYKTLSFIFLNEYMKISDENFRKLLFEKILENNSLIKYSSQLIKVIVENVVDITVSDMENNLNSIKEDESPLWKMFNNANNEFLDEVLLNIFEEKIIAFFDSIDKLDKETLEELYPQYFEDNKNKNINNETGIILDYSFTIFQQVTQYLEQLINLEKELNDNELNYHLAKLYSIVYIKYYLYKLVYTIKEKKAQINNRDKMKEIFYYIKNLSTSFSRVIKLYIFKLFYNSMNNNYEEFIIYDFKESWIDFLHEFDSDSDEDNNRFLKYYFLPLDNDDYPKYQEEMNLFDMYQKNGFNVSTEDLNKLIKKYGLDIFLTVSINKIISNLGSKTYTKDKDEYSNFSSFIKTLFDNDKEDLLTFKLKKLLYLFYNSDTFKEKTKKLLGYENDVINPQLFEMILYGFRLCINILDTKNKENNYLYKSFFEKNYSDTIEKTFIPGIDISDDNHLIFLDDVDYHMQYFEDTYGCYVCSCGCYYSIGPCGFPDMSSANNCRMCNLPIGYAPKPFNDGGSPRHGMVLREGHLRIFKNQIAKDIQMKKFKENDEHIPNILYEDYKKKIIEPIRKKNSIGFNPVSQDFFLKQEKTTRNLTDIGYRLLNFIAYSFLFFGYCIDNISREKLEKYCVKDMSILKIIEADWNYLTEALKKKNINSVQIFFNMIFKKLCSKLKQCQVMKKSEEREAFEEDIENLIKESIEDYNTFKEKYIEENKIQIKASNYSFRTILDQLVEYKEEIYPKTEYPYFKYFILTKYKTVDDFWNRMQNKEKYVLTNLILIKIEEIKKLKFLPDFNEFSNLMLEEYSFKISREDASKRSLNEEKIYKNENFRKKLKAFLKVWNEVKDDATKLGCREEMSIKSLSDTDKLKFFLNDNGEIGGGMYIAAAYGKFIEWQNNILKPIIDANPLGGILNNYVDFIKKQIPVQDALPDQIVLIDKKIKDSKYNDIKDIIYSFSERNIFSENGKINYSDYNSFKYDYDSIEEELGRIILPGVCQFEEETKLNFVVYWSEGFRGGNSDIIIKFYNKYPQIDLTEEEKQKVKDYIKKLNKENIEVYNIKKDFKDIFGSLQILIFFLSENLQQKSDETINTVIKKAPGYFKISNDCIDFFKTEGKDITINKLMDLFFIFEHLCFEDLIKNLQLDLKYEISQEQKDKIKNDLIDNYNKKTYSLKDLGAAVRRYISRYLVGLTQNIDIENTRQLYFELSRQELWEEKVLKLDCDLEEELKRHIGNLKLQVSQAYKFYELIGNDDKKDIEFLNEENEQN